MLLMHAVAELSYSMLATACFETSACLLHGNTRSFQCSQAMQLSPPMTLQTWLWHTGLGQSPCAQTSAAAGTAQSQEHHPLATSLRLCRAPASALPVKPSQGRHVQLQLQTCRFKHACSSNVGRNEADDAMHINYRALKPMCACSC